MTLKLVCSLLFPPGFSHLLLYSGKTGQFLQLIICTSLTLLTLQCFMQIPFAYIPLHGKTKLVTHFIIMVLLNKMSLKCQEILVELTAKNVICRNSQLAEKCNK